eukprot:scaffold364841_cov34-Attheya_sp.AAC.3
MASPGINGANEDTYIRFMENRKQGNRSGLDKLFAEPGNTKKNDGWHVTNNSTDSPMVEQQVQQQKKPSSPESQPFTNTNSMFSHKIYSPS